MLVKADKGNIIEDDLVTIEDKDDELVSNSDTQSLRYDLLPKKAGQIGSVYTDLGNQLHSVSVDNTFKSKDKRTESSKYSVENFLKASFGSQ